MSRSPALVALVVVVAAAGTGLVGANGSFGAAALTGGEPVPRSGAGTGLFGGSPAVPIGLLEDDSATAVDPATLATVESDSDDAIRIGVIGSSFGASSSIDGRVAARYRPGGPRFGLASGGDHDTAVANVVAHRTDDSSLYLASVGYEPTPAEYDSAVRWLVEHDVDVIVDAGSYYPRTADGMERITGAAEGAAAAGTVFVTSGGNTARRHWRGTANGAGWLAFDETGIQGNRLGDGPVAGSVTLRLYWEGTGNYDLYLYRDTPGEDDEVVAKSTRESGHAEAIDAVLPRGNYYVAVYAHGTGDGQVDLFAARHGLAHAGANGSAVAPATAEGVISVGAVGTDGQLTAYSPTDTDVQAAGTIRLADGTRLTGTSAAAPAVASVVAAMTANAGASGLTPAEVERLLRTTAEDGRIDADAAVTAAARRGIGDANATNASEEGARAFPGP